jgi:hypothetical protein
MSFLRQRCGAGVAAVAAVAALAVAGPVAGAGAASAPRALPSFPTPGASLFPQLGGGNLNSLCPTIPGFLNLGPTGPLGPLGAYGPSGSAKNLPTGCAAWNLGPSGPLGPGGILNGGPAHP